MFWMPETTLVAAIFSASMCALGKKRLAWPASSEAFPAVLRFLSCSLKSASKEVVRDLPECGGNGSQPNDQGSQSVGGISRFSAAHNDLAQFIQLAQDAVPIGLGLGEFGCSRRQALGRILGIGWI